jgi:Flp pilus assembly protein TadD
VSQENANSYNNRGVVLMNQGRFAEAEAALSKALELAPDFVGARSNLGSVLLLEGRYGEAARSYGAALEIRRRALAPQSPDIAVSLLGLGLALAEGGHAADAEAPLREALAIRSAAAEPKPWRTAPVESALGFSLLARKRYEAAEPLLLAGYQTLLGTDGPLGLQRRMARDWIVRLYEETGRATDASAWRSPPGADR